MFKPSMFKPSMFKLGMFKLGMFRLGLLRIGLLRLGASVVIGLAVLPGATTVLSQSFKDDPLPAGDAKDKATSCLVCHGARIIVQQRLSKAAWGKEVDKMTKWGAQVDPKDRDALVDYLSANFGPDQPAYQAPTSAQESKSKTKAKH